MAQLNLPTYDQMDSWGHTLTYEVWGDRAIVGTLGRDGKPGGIGFDGDFTSELQRTPRPTLAQIMIVTGQPTVDGYLGQCLLCCIFNGFAWAFALARAYEENPPIRTRTWKILNYGGILGLFAVTVFGALVMAALDVPSGH